MEASQPTPTEKDTFEEHPEFLVGAALLGGIILAQVLKRLGSSD